MNDLIKTQPDVELSVQAALQWLKEVGTSAEKLFEDDFEAGLKALHYVETIEVGATKTRMDQVMREAAHTKFKIGRAAGKVLQKVISHEGGFQTLYGHLSEVFVDLNQQVVSGKIVGTVGVSGKTTGAHLHFEIRRGGSLEDPLRFFP